MFGRKNPSEGGAPKDNRVMLKMVKSILFFGAALLVGLYFVTSYSTSDPGAAQAEPEPIVQEYAPEAQAEPVPVEIPEAETQAPPEDLTADEYMAKEINNVSRSLVTASPDDLTGAAAYWQAHVARLALSREPTGCVQNTVKSFSDVINYMARGGSDYRPRIGRFNNYADRCPAYVTAERSWLSKRSANNVG